MTEGNLGNGSEPSHEGYYNGYWNCIKPSVIKTTRTE